MIDPSIRQLKLEAVIDGCQSESGRREGNNDGYCFELFRRALEDNEQAAWAAIDRQYKNLILHWIYRSAPALSKEEAEEVAPQALPKFWRILDKSTTPLADRFGHVGALLKYLKQCAISVLRDHERREQRRKRLRLRLPKEPDLTTCEQELLNRVDRERLVRLVRNWIDAYVTDSQERRVLCLSFEQGLTPRQIIKEYPNEFNDIHEVRRIKERILKRAKRALGHLGQENDDGSMY